MAVEGNLGPTVLGKDACEWDGIFPESALVLLAIHIAADFSLVSTFSEDTGVFTDLCLRFRSTAEEVLEIQLNEPVWSIGFKEPTLVLGREADCTNEFSCAQISIDEFAFSRNNPLELHEMGVAHHLFVGGTDESIQLIRAVSRAALIGFLFSLTKPKEDVGVTTHRSCIFSARDTRIFAGNPSSGEAGAWAYTHCL